MRKYIQLFNFFFPGVLSNLEVFHLQLTNKQTYQAIPNVFADKRSRNKYGTFIYHNSNIYRLIYNISLMQYDYLNATRIHNAQVCRLANALAMLT